MIGALLGTDVFVVGVEPDPKGCRVYIGARWRGRYFLVTEPEWVEKFHRAWNASFMGHLTMPRESVPYLLTEYRA
jgi:hypothetical protein